MDWQQISVVTSEASCETVAEALTALGAVSITFSDAGDQPLYEPPPGSHPVWNKTAIRALFEKPVNLETVRESILRQLPGTATEDWQKEVIADRVWEREWMDQFKPMQFGERLWVCPSHLPPPNRDAVNLYLDPGLAFGTGTHPTTRLCLERLSSENLDGLRIIDYGCGSGILAIAAILLGAKQAVAVDIDEQALSATLENAIRNGVESSISCRRPGEIDDRPAELVIANILANPLQELAATISGLVQPGGKLILSGILKEQADEVRKAYLEDFVFFPPAVCEGWALLAGRKAPERKKRA